VARYLGLIKPRPLNAAERRLLDFLLSADFAGRDALLEQAATVRTRGSSCDCGCPSFFLDPDRATEPAAVQDTVPVDAHGIDPGGNSVGVLLFVTNGYLSEVEVFGWEGSDFAGLPAPDDLKISEWSEPDEAGARRLLNPT
jgi:hypothetical protein